MKYLHSIVSVFIFLLFHFAAVAGWQNGEVAPDWSLTDIEGKTYKLHDILNSGKHVILEFTASWCKSSWKYHKSGKLQTLWEMYGPEGTDEIMIFMIEADMSTNSKCLHGSTGCVGGTNGNWVNGTKFPVISITGKNGNTLPAQYKLKSYPSLFVINAKDKRCFKAGQPTIAGWQSWLFQSFKMTCLAEVKCNNEQISNNVTLTVFNGAGTKQYAWNNGMNSQSLIQAGPGEYKCRITDKNGYFITTQTLSLSQDRNVAEYNAEGALVMHLIASNQTVFSVNSNIEAGLNVAENLTINNIGPDEERILHQFISGQDRINSRSSNSNFESLKIYPNPASAFVSADVKFKTDNPASITLYDRTGKLMERSDIKGNSSLLIDVSHYETGVFFLVVRDHKEFHIRKLFVVR